MQNYGHAKHAVAVSKRGSKIRCFERLAQFEALESRQMLSANVSSLTTLAYSTANHATNAADAAGFTSISTPEVVLPVEVVPVGASANQTLTPQQIRQAYEINGIGFTKYNADGTTQAIAGDGTGQTIAIIDAGIDPNISSDLQAFDSTYNIAAPPSFAVQAIAGATRDPVDRTGGWAFETALDVEWAHAIAPGANILLVETADGSNIGDLIAGVDYARHVPNVSVISMSWGKVEEDSDPFFDQYFTTPSGHTPITFVASTGDQKEGEAADYPALSPNVLAVGGTDFVSDVDAHGDYVSEEAWSSGGGGTSSSEGQPYYQNFIFGVPPITLVSGRKTPDVSFDAGTQVFVYDSYDLGSSSPWGGATGTSLSAPCWAGLIAIANQGRDARALPRLGNQYAMDLLYRIGSNQNGLPTYSAAFHDITSGSTGYYQAVPGYDEATGFGTPIAPAVVEGLAQNIASPTLLAPITGTVSTVAPTFEWSAVAGALGYQFELFADDKLFFVSPPLHTTSYTPTTPLIAPGFNWSWAVLAVGVLSNGQSSAIPLYNPLLAPGIVSPANDSFTPTATPTFQWTSVPGAVSYTLQIVDTSLPNLLVVDTTTLTNTSYTPSSPLTVGHQYSWSVAAHGSFNGVPYTIGIDSFIYFTVGPQPAFTILSPSLGATVATSTPTFSWTSQGVPSYLLTLTDENTASTQTYSISNALSFTPPVPLPSGHTYRWTVSAVGSSAPPQSSVFTVSLPGAVMSNLVAPAPISPIGAVTAANSNYATTFNWSAVPGATSYGLYIQGNASSPMLFAGVVSGTSYTWLPNVAGGTALWWVVAIDSAGNVSPASPVENFSLASPNTDHAAPTVTGPTGNLTAAPTWTFPTAPSGSIYITAVVDLTTNQITYGVPNPSGPVNPYSVDYEDGGHTYRWYVQLFDATGSGPAVTGTYTVPPPASLPTSVSPTAGTVETTRTPTFTWNAVSGATGYDFYIINPSLLGASVYTANTSNTSLTVTTPLNSGSYQWYVRAVVPQNVGIQPIPESALTSFIVSVPGVPSLVSPTDGATASTSRPLFQWTAASGASGYNLTVVDTTSNQLVLTQLGLTSTSFTPSAPLTSGHTFNWYVTAVDVAGDEGIPSQTGTFAVNVSVPAPTIVALSATIPTNSPDLQWSSVADAVGYNLTLKDLTANVVVINSLPVTDTEFTPAGLANGDTYQWTITAQDDAGNASDPQSGQFTVSLPAITFTTPTLTAFNNPVTTRTPDLQWSTIPGASSYHVVIEDLTTGANVIDTPVVGTDYTVGTPLNAEDSYSWRVLAFDSSGNYSNWSAPSEFAVVLVPGDYSANGVVDAADYVLWRKTLGTSGVPFSGADGNGNGTVDQADYDVWRSNFGNSASHGSAIVSATGSESLNVNTPPVLTIASAIDSEFDPATQHAETAAKSSLQSNEVIASNSRPIPMTLSSTIVQAELNLLTYHAMSESAWSGTQVTGRLVLNDAWNDGSYQRVSAIDLLLGRFGGIADTPRPNSDAELALKDDGDRFWRPEFKGAEQEMDGAAVAAMTDAAFTDKATWKW